MTLDELRNAIAILRSIDGHELPDNWSDGFVVRFLRSPYETFLAMDSDRQQAVFDVIRRRMQPRLPLVTK